MDRKIFFDRVRRGVFGGRLSTTQVDGLSYILAEADRRGVNNEFLAKILATAAWETAKTMQPIREYGRGKGRSYGKPHPKTGQAYYGRGYVQLTWYENYLKASTKLGVDFVSNPDLVMVPKHAVRILFEGMLEGWFTGKKLSDYLDGVDESDAEDLREFANARRIINGTDRQIEIGKIALAFESALRASRRAETGAPPQPTSPTAPARPEAPVAAPEALGLLARILRIIIKLFT